MDYDFIAIGDIVTDAFIRLQDAEIHCDIKHEDCQICLRFGDKVPYENVTIVAAVGNSPNAATSAARLGLRSAVITNLGDDQNGADAIETLNKNGVGTDLITKHTGQKTNYHYVLWYQDDRTILIKHEEYAYALPEFTTKWIYLSSLGENSLPFHSKIEEYLVKHPEVKLAFQPGTFQIKLGYEKLRGLYKHTEIFFCNVDEARRILNRKNSSDEKEIEIKNLLKEIRGLGPKIAVITDGKDGAYASDSNNTWFMKPYPDPKPPLERTGAGDSFASTVVSALALDKDLAEALRWGPINSMSVVQQVGAQAGLLKREKLEEFLKGAPTDYLPKII